MLGLQRVYPVAGELAERMESTYIELKDISQEAVSYTHLFLRLNSVENRQDFNLYTLVPQDATAILETDRMPLGSL